MAKKKVYAVKKGKKTGLFLTWEACKAAVDGYSGAEYKSFFSKEEAEVYLAGDKNPLLDQDAENDVNNKENQIVAYVDGSFNKELGKYAFGCVLIKPDGEIIRESGNGDNPESLELRNVTGEMLGAMYAVKWCEINGYSAVIICYDYMGIEMWATGGWKANKSLTQKYAAFMQESSRRIRITFHKIAAHTGDKYNEEADKLAKAALVEGNGIPKIKKVQSEGE
ncbi:MAG: ribonuclease H family protein [Lachnospiraceae bacterium]|nr:ribonuclease H family protein [Lachnospiraceae bacterium]